MGLFDWIGDLFDDDEKEKPRSRTASKGRTRSTRPTRTNLSAPAPTPTPAPTPYNREEYFGNHRGPITSPGVVYRPQPNRDRPAPIEGPHYYAGTQPYDPAYFERIAAEHQARLKAERQGRPTIVLADVRGGGGAPSPNDEASATPSPETVEGRGASSSGKARGPLARRPKNVQPVVVTGTANQPTTQVLRALGWTTPDIPVAVVDETMFVPGGQQTVTGYNYRVDPEEVGLLQDAYRNSPGFIAPTAPTDVTQDNVLVTGITRAAPLTLEAYNALSGDQRRAVEFNTALLQARQMDLEGKNLPEYNKDEYDAKVANMFGARGGSNTYAPNVVDLLDKIGFSARGQDLDEFLSLERGVTADELDKVNLKTEGLLQWEWPESKKRSTAERRRNPGGGERFIDIPAEENQYAQSRGIANQMVVDAIAIGRAGEFLDEARKAPGAWDFNSAVTKALTGALPTGKIVPWGFGTPADRMDENGNILSAETDKDAWFQGAYTALRNPDNDLSLIWSKINERGLDDNAVQELFNYFDLKTQQDIASGFVDPDLRSPQDIRVMMGWET